MKGRSVDDQLLQAVWTRQGGKCQGCGKPVPNVFDSYEQMIEDILARDHIPIYRWTKDCWKCKKPTSVVTYYVVADRPYSMGDVEKLDYTLMAKYPFVRKHLSRLLGCEVVASACVNCGSPQGNRYVADEMASLISSGSDVDALVDARLPNNLEREDFPPGEPGKSSGEDESQPVAYVHRKDGGRKNNSPESLVLLCGDCHEKARST